MMAAGSALALAACGDGSGPSAGELAVQLTSATAPRALLLEVTGPQTGVSVPAGSGYQVSVAPRGADTARIAIVAPQGATIATGVVARVSVANTGLVSSYSVRVIQAAGANYALLPANGFVVAVTR